MSRRYVTIRGTRIQFATVGKTMPKGYERISRKCKLYELAGCKLKGQEHQATYLHIAICAVAHGRPPGQIGVGKNKWSVDHKNGDCYDNSPGNLQWMLHSENTAKGNSTRKQLAG